MKVPADPKLPFYITADLNPDGTLDIDSEGKAPMSLEGAISLASDLITDHGGVQYVIECRAIRKLSWRTPRVDTVKTAPQRPKIVTQKSEVAS